MIPPRGFKSELYPLRHEFVYSFGLNMGAQAINSSMMTFVKNYKGANLASGREVNPRSGDFSIETGAICVPMSIIDKLKFHLTFTLAEDGLADGFETVKIQYMPIFNSFDGRIDESDVKTSSTVAALLELTKDATQEDITPAFGTKTSVGTAANELSHPVSTDNFTEVFGTLNLTTNTTMEGVPWDNTTFFRALRYYTNKGALQSCVGKMRTITLTKNRPIYSTFVKRFVPRDVRRIQPYSFFAMLVHMPLDTDVEQAYYTGAATSGKVAVGVKCKVSYDEWNADHDQDIGA